MMRVLFMGSDEVACPSLRRLLESEKDEVIGVVSQPDRPKGRKRRLAPCALKAFAEERNRNVFSPEKIGSEEAVAWIEALTPDIIVVVAYGQYVPSSILAIPQHGAINVHPSLLPKYRGAAPIQMAIADGQSETGVTILYVSRKMDAGDILLQKREPIHQSDTALTLGPRLAEKGAEMILHVLDQHRSGHVSPVPQEEEAATCVHKLTKEDGRIDWTMSAVQIRNRIRGFQPWPICCCECPAGSNLLLRVYEAEIEPLEGIPGHVLSIEGVGPVVATGQQSLRLLKVQPPGRKVMSGDAYLRGHGLSKGANLA